MFKDSKGISITLKLAQKVTCSLQPPCSFANGNFCNSITQSIYHNTELENFLEGSQTPNMSALIPSRRNGQNGAMGPKCLRIFKLSKSVNWKGIHSGPKLLSHGLSYQMSNGIRHVQRNIMEQESNGNNPTPLLKIIMCENETTHEHVKLSANHRASR